MPGVPVGGALPEGDPFGVSVSLPLWADTLAWAERDATFLARLQTGYPRFFIPHVVRELASCVLRYVQDSGIPTSYSSSNMSNSALVLANLPAAQEFRAYLKRCRLGDEPIIRVGFDRNVELVEYGDHGATESTTRILPVSDIYVVPYSEDAAAEAKAFWQHTGLGVSSRCATYWMEHGSIRQLSPESPSMPASLPLDEASRSKETLCQRIAGFTTVSPSEEDGKDNIFLYPTGMAAINSTAVAIKRIVSLSSGDGKDDLCRVAVFGFLYVDTFKVLSKIHGIDCVLYGHASDADMAQLEHDLKSGIKIHSLYTEFPGNPLMRSPDLERLEELSSEYGFLLVVDDTIGTFANVALTPHCDVLCTSLTKMFSGGCNVMGGSVVLNPRSPRYEKMRQSLAAQPSVFYFPLDIITMEENSRDFGFRMRQANDNAAMAAAILREHESVSKVFYPKGCHTQTVYDRFRREGGGYGFLISIEFMKPAAAIAFYDALNVSKGPSLGTNFTLCCAYTLLAHYQELEWASRFGVTEHLVRISVGIENPEVLRDTIINALEVAKETLGNDHVEKVEGRQHWLKGVL